MFDNFVQKPYSSCNVIVPATDAKGCLMIGDFNSATDTEKISAHNIKTIITAATNMDHLDIDKSLHHIVYPLLDAKTEAISTFFEQNFDTIESSLKKGGVLVHCAAGVSRSATLVIAYLMKKNLWGFKEAIGFVRKSRPEVCPNLGFQIQLKKYEKEINKKIEERLSKTMIPTKSNPSTVSFNQFLTAQNNIGFPVLTTFSRKQSRSKQENKESRTRPGSKEELFGTNKYEDLAQKGLMITSFGCAIKPRLSEYHSSSAHRSQRQILEQEHKMTNKKIAALMFQSKMSRSIGPNAALRKSQIKVSSTK